MHWVLEHLKQPQTSLANFHMMMLFATGTGEFRALSPEEDSPAGGCNR